MVILGAGPAGAQYGGGIQVFVDPVRVPIDQTFDVFGRDCAPGSTVVISIDGVPGTIGTTTATAGGFFSIQDLPLPDGLSAGTDHDVRATCDAQTATAMITLVCPSGDDPVDGSCEDGSGGIVGGPGPTTTTTTPGGATTTVPAGGGGTSGGGTSGGGSGGLAVTGATFVEQIAQVGVTLFGAGVMLVMIARRRREEALVLETG